MPANTNVDAVSARLTALENKLSAFFDRFDPSMMQQPAPQQQPAMQFPVQQQGTAPVPFQAPVQQQTRRRREPTFGQFNPNPAEYGGLTLEMLWEVPAERWAFLKNYGQSKTLPYVPSANGKYTVPQQDTAIPWFPKQRSWSFTAMTRKQNGEHFNDMSDSQKKGFLEWMAKGLSSGINIFGTGTMGPAAQQQPVQQPASNRRGRRASSMTAPELETAIQQQPVQQPANPMDAFMASLSPEQRAFMESMMQPQQQPQQQPVQPVAPSALTDEHKDKIRTAKNTPERSRRSSNKIAEAAAILGVPGIGNRGILTDAKIAMLAKAARVR